MTTTPGPEALPYTHTGPCEPWPLDWDCTDCKDLVGSPGDSPGEDAAVERWSMIATSMLWRMSGRRWGPLCPITVRPCLLSCLNGSGMFPNWSAASPFMVPYIDAGGVWRNAVPCGCSTDCSCGELCEVRLDGPIYDILQVTVDGVVLPPETYRVDIANKLVRIDGECWPTCQDMAAAPTEPDTFTVTYRVGLHLDEHAVAAVSELTCELLKACGLGPPGCAPCKLPANTTRIVRQGLTIEAPGAAGALFADGRTGLATVDAWLALVNPGKLPMPSRVYSPDLVRPRARWL